MKGDGLSEPSSTPFWTEPFLVFGFNSRQCCCMGDMGNWLDQVA